MEAYRRWVWRNREFLRSLESFANGLRGFFPNGSPIPRSLPKQDCGFPWSLCLSALKELETLVEVVAQCLYGDEKKWNSIAAIEGIKAMIHLIILRESGYKMLLNGGVSMNATDLDSSQPSGRNGPVCSDALRRGGSHGPGNFHDFRLNGQPSHENRALAALGRFGENAMMDYKPTGLSRTQHPDCGELFGYQQPKPTLASIYAERGLLGGIFVFGVLHIMRPVIYVLFIRKYGLRSWKPWFWSFSVDIVALGLISFTSNRSSKNRCHPFQVTTTEKELRRRKFLWAFYVLRDPFFTKYTRYHLENSERILNPIPFVGFFAAKLVELIIGVQTRYTYTSAS